MVTATEVGQLAGECNLWRGILRSFRNGFIKYQTILLQIAAGQDNKDVMLEIEHLHNQIYIQLINIHDLKQEIKKHVATIGAERSLLGRMTDYTLARHEFIFDEYQRLETGLHILSREFDRFMKYMSQA